MPEEKDLFFKLSHPKPNVIVFAQIINCRMTEIFMQNNTNNALIIAGKSQLEKVVEYKADRCYRAHIDAVDTMLIKPQCLTICNCMAYNNHTNSSKSTPNNNTTIYADLDTVNTIGQIAQKFELSLLTDTATTVDFSKSKQMDITPIAN